MRMNIEAERSRRGLTKTALAEAIGVSLNTYSSYVNGSDIPSSKLIALSDEFGVTIDYLLGRKPPVTPSDCCHG